MSYRCLDMFIQHFLHELNLLLNISRGYRIRVALTAQSLVDMGQAFIAPAQKTAQKLSRFIKRGL
jgi:hypothetical protein